MHEVTEQTIKHFLDEADQAIALLQSCKDLFAQDKVDLRHSVKTDLLQLVKTMLEPDKGVDDVDRVFILNGRAAVFTLSAKDGTLQSVVLSADEVEKILADAVRLGWV